MTGMRLAKIYGSICKVEDQDDGTIMVYGIASSESRDGVGEIILAEAMRGALPDYTRFPALREMHQPMAAGRVVEVDVDDDGVTHIAAHVVDPIAIVKVRTGVYAGFSIGGKVLKRDPQDRTVITALKLIEISLVDSPCNPDAILSMWKADMSDFKPESAEVIARAKTLAKAAGTQRFKDYLFEASQELIAEHLLKSGEIDEPGAEAAAPVVEAAAEPAGDAPKEASAQPGEGEAEAAPAADANAEAAPAGEAEGKDAAAQPGDGGEAAPEAGAEPAGEGEGDAAKAAEADPAAALADALSKAGEAIEAAAPADASDAPALFADFGKAAGALRSIGCESPLAKGLWHVTRFADLLESFGYLQQSIACEANWEGDGSQVPAKVAEAIANLGAALIAMTQEEVAEFLAEIVQVEPEIEIIYAGEGIELAGQIVDLVKANAELMEKAGARNSAADLERIQQSHDHMAKLGAKCDVENCEGEDADKAAALEAENDRLSKALEDGAAGVGDLTKRFEETIEGLKGQIADLSKRFEDEPLPLKSAGPAAVRTVSKGTDATGAAGGDGAALSKEQFDDAWGKLSDQEKGEIMLKVALANPQAIGATR
jgi:phage head maturation protease